jgi:DsbC/DsbD-like thiol-disulfide interchange protein
MTMKHTATICIALSATLAVGLGSAASAAEPTPAQSAAPASIATPAPAPETPYDTASKLYQAGKQAEALVTLQQLAEAGDARAQYLVGLDLIEGKYIKLDYAQGFAYLVLATEDKAWGDLVAPRAREARAVVEPQLSGVDLIHADRLIAAYKQRKK